MLELPQWSYSNKYPKHIFCEEIRTKQELSYISFCPLRILYNSKFIIMATSLGTNSVIVTRVHCSSSALLLLLPLEGCVSWLWHFLGIFTYILTFDVFQGPVQSIISLTSLLVVKMLTALVSTISNSQVFLLKNVSSFCKCKSYSHFFSAKIVTYMPYLLIKDLTLC